MERFYTLYPLFPSRFLANLQTTCLIYKRHQKQSPLDVSLKKVLFAKFTGNTCARALNFIKKETLAQVFSCEFCGISGYTFSYRTHCLKKSGRTRGTRNEELEVLKELFLLPVTDNTFIQIFLMNESVAAK